MSQLRRGLASPLGSAVGWWVTRMALLLFAAHQRGPAPEVKYYYKGVTGQGSALREYPDLGVVPLRVLHLLTGDDRVHFTVAFAALILLCDAALTWYLARRHAWWAVWFWLLSGLALAPIYTRRLDLMAGLLVAWAAALLTRRGPASAILTACATAVKLWPAALLAGLVGHWRASGTWMRLGWAGLTLVATVALTTVTQGWDRVTSPLDYQVDRGLQTESVAATPFLWAHWAAPQRWKIDYAASKSFEVFGPHVSVGLAATTVLSIAVAAVILGVALRAFLRTGALTPTATRALWLVSIAGILVSSKVFSPQYLMWVTPLLAVMLALDGRPRSLIGGACAVTLAACVLTTAVYPLTFNGFISSTNPSAVSYLYATGRNLLIVALLVIAGMWLWRTLRHPQDAAES